MSHRKLDRVARPYHVQDSRLRSFGTWSHSAICHDIDKCSTHPASRNVLGQARRAPTLLSQIQWHLIKRVSGCKANHVLMLLKCTVIRARIVPVINTKSLGKARTARMSKTALFGDYFFFPPRRTARIGSLPP